MAPPVALHSWAFHSWPKYSMWISKNVRAMNEASYNWIIVALLVSFWIAWGPFRNWYHKLSTSVVVVRTIWTTNCCLKSILEISTKPQRKNGSGDSMTNTNRNQYTGGTCFQTNCVRDHVICWSFSKYWRREKPLISTPQFSLCRFVSFEFRLLESLLSATRGLRNHHIFVTDN